MPTPAYVSIEETTQGASLQVVSQRTASVTVMWKDTKTKSLSISMRSCPINRPREVVKVSFTASDKDVWNKS
jgi:hypothetical protein